MKMPDILRRYSLSVWMMVLTGGGVVIAMLFMALFAEYLSFYDPISTTQDVLFPPGGQHLMGTDSLGRDVFSRLLFGARTSIGVALFAVIIAASTGSTLGILSAYKGGNIDRGGIIFVDAFYAFPAFLLALVVAFMMGTGLINTGVAVGVAWIPYFFRTTRSVTLAAKESLLIELERSFGASDIYVISRHLIHYCLPSILVLIPLNASHAIMAVCGLGFLGYGIPQPTPEWGTDLNMARTVFTIGAWWPTVFPSLMVVMLSLALNLLSDGLNIILNPRYRVR